MSFIVNISYLDEEDDESEDDDDDLEVEDEAFDMYLASPLNRTTLYSFLFAIVACTIVYGNFSFNVSY